SRNRTGRLYSHAAVIFLFEGRSMLRPIDHDIFVPAGDCASQPGAAETLRRLFLSQCSSRTPTAATIHRQPIRSGCNTPPCSSSRRIWQTRSEEHTSEL